MSTSIKPYRHPKTGVYYFRRVVSKSLRSILGWEIKFSLNTRVLKEAQRLCNVELLNTDRVFIQVTNNDFHSIKDYAREDCTLLGLFDKYASDRQPTYSTEISFRRAVLLFDSLYSDIPAFSITRAMVREYKDLLLSVPAYASNYEKELSLTDLSKNSRNRKVISTGSINKHIRAVSAVLSWAESNGYFDSHPNWINPTIGVRVKRSKESAPRTSFDTEDVRKIFNGSVFTSGYRPHSGGCEAAYWIPLIALYTGARLEEIGQLLAEDIRFSKEYSVWYFDINNNGGKRLKTKSSVRKIPVHHKLIELGLIDYKSSLKDVRLFPEFTRGRDGKLTTGWSKWFRRYLTSVGLCDSRKVFHSFRHTMKDALRNAGVDEAISDAITGHTNSSVGRSYGYGYNLNILNEAIHKVSYDITLERERW